MAAYCPHCLSEVAGRTPWPAQPERCAQCRLLIGARRAIDAGEAARRGGEGSASAAASVAANAARRSGAEAIEPQAALAALRTVARELGCPVQRLRMLDYDHAAQREVALPPLAVVLATLGSWRTARSAAVVRPPTAARADRDARSLSA